MNSSKNAFERSIRVDVPKLIWVHNLCYLLETAEAKYVMCKRIAEGVYLAVVDCLQLIPSRTCTILRHDRFNHFYIGLESAGASDVVAPPTAEKDYAIRIAGKYILRVCFGILSICVCIQRCSSNFSQNITPLRFIR